MNTFGESLRQKNCCSKAPNLFKVATLLVVLFASSGCHRRGFFFHKDVAKTKVENLTTILPASSIIETAIRTSVDSITNKVTFAPIKLSTTSGRDTIYLSIDSSGVLTTKIVKDSVVFKNVVLTKDSVIFVERKAQNDKRPKNLFFKGFTFGVIALLILYAFLRLRP